MPLEIVKKYYRTYQITYEDIVGAGLSNIGKIAKSEPPNTLIRPKVFNSFEKFKEYFINEALNGRGNIIMCNVPTEIDEEFSPKEKQYFADPPITINNCEKVEIYILKEAVKTKQEPQNFVANVMPVDGQRQPEPQKIDKNLLGIQEILNLMSKGITPQVNVPMMAGPIGSTPVTRI